MAFYTKHQPLHGVRLPLESDLYVHASGNEWGHGSSEAWHFNDVITGVSMRPGNKQIWDVHWRGYTDWIITLIDLTGDKINVILSLGSNEICTLFFFSSLLFWQVLNW